MISSCDFNGSGTDASTTFKNKIVDYNVAENKSRLSMNKASQKQHITTTLELEK